MPEFSMCIGTITAGTPRYEYVTSVMKARSSLPYIKSYVLHQTTYLHYGREEIVRDFLAKPDAGEFLLFIDDDTQFTPEAIERLRVVAEADPSKLILGGIYWTPRHGSFDSATDIFPVVFKYQSGIGGTVYEDTFEYRPFPRGWTAAQTEPFTCDAIGTGFLMIHRSVLERMKNTFPAPLHSFTMETINGVACGEDLCFCYRAQSLNYKIWAVPLGHDDIYHIKTVAVRCPVVE